MNTSKYNGKYAKRPTPKSKQSRFQDSLNRDQDKQSYPEQEQEQQKKNRNNELEINDGTPPYRVNQSDVLLEAETDEFATGKDVTSKVGADKVEAGKAKCTQSGVEGLSARQQQFVLKFCSQLASVIEACEQSESAEIEVGRRQINRKQIKVKLQADRELTVDSNSRNNRRH